MGLPRRRSGSTYSVGSLVNAGNGLDGLGIVSVVCSLASRSVSNRFDPRRVPLVTPFFSSRFPSFPVYSMSSMPPDRIPSPHMATCPVSRFCVIASALRLFCSSLGWRAGLAIDLRVRCISHSSARSLTNVITGYGQVTTRNRARGNRSPPPSPTRALPCRRPS